MERNQETCGSINISSTQMTDIWPKIEMSGPDCIINSQMNCCLTSRTQWGCVKQWYKSWRGTFRCTASPIWRSPAVLAQLKKNGFLSKPLCTEIPWPRLGREWRNSKEKKSPVPEPVCIRSSLSFFVFFVQMHIKPPAADTILLWPQTVRKEVIRCSRWRGPLFIKQTSGVLVKGLKCISKIIDHNTQKVFYAKMSAKCTVSACFWAGDTCGTRTLRMCG